MMTQLIYIISNVSDKIERIAGSPYCIVNGKPESIVSDKIKINMYDNSLNIEFGYHQHGMKKHVNLKAEIKINSQDMYYVYKVPFLLDGTGKLKQVSKKYYCIYGMSSYIFNNTLFLLVCVIALIIVKALLII